MRKPDPTESQSRPAVQKPMPQLDAVAERRITLLVEIIAFPPCPTLRVVCPFPV